MGLFENEVSDDRLPNNCKLWGSEGGPGAICNQGAMVTAVAILCTEPLCWSVASQQCGEALDSLLSLVLAWSAGPMSPTPVVPREGWTIELSET